MPTDTERLDWLEANKGSRGGWNIIPPGDGWQLQIYTRGPRHSLRAAIDHAMSLRPPQRSEEAAP